jgi:hypothetical protein
MRPDVPEPGDVMGGMVFFERTDRGVIEMTILRFCCGVGLLRAPRCRIRWGLSGPAWRSWRGSSRVAVGGGRSVARSLTAHLLTGALEPATDSGWGRPPVASTEAERYDTRRDDEQPARRGVRAVRAVDPEHGSFSTQKSRRHIIPRRKTGFDTSTGCTGLFARRGDRRSQPRPRFRPIGRRTKRPPPGRENPRRTPAPGTLTWDRHVLRLVSGRLPRRGKPARRFVRAWMVAYLDDGVLRDSTDSGLASELTAR